jgi:predicted ABC-type ATPase
MINKKQSLKHKSIKNKSIKKKVNKINKTKNNKNKKKNKNNKNNNLNTIHTNVDIKKPIIKLQCNYKEIDFQKIKKTMLPEKIAIFMIGSPGSGKSTIKELFVKSIHKTMEDFINLDPDYIMSQLPNYQNLIKSDETKSKAAEQCYNSSYIINDVLYTMAQNQNYNIILDGTGKEYKWTSGQIENLYYLGYTIYICIVIVDDVNISIKRAQKRGLETGRIIMPSNIIKINEQINKIIPLYKSNKRAKTIIIYNNTKKPNIIYHKIKK